MKDVKGFEGFYSVTRDGRIWSHPRVGNSKNGKWMSLSQNNHGYFIVRLQKKGIGKSVSVHRIVALAFVKNPLSKPEVNHKNGCKTDNRAENLEWCSMAENMAHAVKSGVFRKKLTENDVLKIRELRTEGMTLDSISKIFKVNNVMVWAIVHRKAWKHI